MIMSFILKTLTTKLLMKAIATDSGKVFILRVLTSLSERTDTPFDDDLVRIVKELMDGNTSSVKIKRKKS